MLPPRLDRTPKISLPGTATEVEPTCSSLDYYLQNSALFRHTPCLWWWLVGLKKHAMTNRPGVFVARFRRAACLTFIVLMYLSDVAHSPSALLQELPKPKWGCLTCQRSFDSLSAAASHVRSKQHEASWCRCRECGRTVSVAGQDT